MGRADEAEIEALCAAAGVNSLWGYVSQDPDELAEFLEGEGMEAEGEPEAEEWFEPEEGLSFVEKLSGYLKSHPQAKANDWLFLGDIYEQLGMFEEARKAYDYSLALLTADLPVTASNQPRGAE